ncbi:MAG: aminodeoxychorismate/anthranilate synthase component II [Planctomycetota bacterium]
MSKPHALLRVLLLDHADSFVFVLADQFARIGASVDVVRVPDTADAIAELVARQHPDLVVLSPGPGHPSEAVGTMDWLRSRPVVPVLGICLGHQAIGLAVGARIERGAAPMHGVASEIEVLDDPLFRDLPRQLQVARYHSLVVVDPPETLAVIAHTDGVVMALRHRRLPWIGLQFHPESVLTPHGGPLLRAVLDEVTRQPRTEFSLP